MYAPFNQVILLRLL